MRLGWPPGTGWWNLRRFTASLQAERRLAQASPRSETGQVGLAKKRYRYTATLDPVTGEGLSPVAPIHLEACGSRWI